MESPPHPQHSHDPQHSHGHGHFHRHEHGGRSSRVFFTAEEVVDGFGLEEGQVFLDVGCGDGHLSLAAARKVGQKGIVHAVDIHRESIEKLHEELGELGRAEPGLAMVVVPMITDVTQPASIPLKEGSVDVALLSNVLHGFVQNGEVEPVLSQLTRALRPGGRLVVIEFLKQEGIGPPLEERLSQSEVAELLSGWGFVAEHEFRAGDEHYGLRLRLEPL